MNSSSSTLKQRMRRLGPLWHDSSGKCVIYVMSRDQRVASNFALLAAQKHALAHSLPLAVVFCLSPNIQGRAREHFNFMIEGLKEVEKSLSVLNIPFMMLIGNHNERLPGLVHHTQPAAVYVDMNPLQWSLQWQEQLATTTTVIQVDTHNTVPVWLASDKQEVGARTLRPKIHRLLGEFAEYNPEDTLTMHPHSWPGTVMSLKELEEQINSLVKGYKKNGTHITWPSGEQSAIKHLDTFIINKLHSYATNRNNPTINGLSDLSPYLHFGQLSSLQVLHSVRIALENDLSLQASVDVLVEEMIVRKELSDNYCFYNANYNSIAGAPMWAQATLTKHAKDEREFIYSLDEFEEGQTHDPAWNAAQNQLRTTGKMHGYMRMYWAKKVLEWSTSPDEALQTLTYLNDFYSIDGGDPSGYVGILWSIAGLHDRPWGERPVYGMVRSMVYNGLKRKFNIEQYIFQNSSNETISH